MDDRNLEEFKELVRSQLVLTQMMEQHDRIVNDHEKRIRVMERLFAYGAGAVGIILYFLKTFNKI